MLHPNPQTSGHGLLRLAPLVGLVTAFIAPGNARGAAEQLSITYPFDRPTVSTVQIAGKPYDRVTMAGVPNGGNAGQPALPARGARVLLPMGTRVSSVAVVPGEKVLLGSGYFVEPVGEQVPLTAPPSAAVPPTPDPAIYGSDSPFPATLFTQIGTQCFRGYRILILRLQPVQYVPTSGELYYYPDLTVVVDTVAADTPALFRGLPQDMREVLAKVDNPELADTYVVSGEPVRGGYDLLILTTPSLSGTFQPLADYHSAHGLATEIRTTTDVGSNSPDDVRDYIRECYESDGIDYVIIGADDDIIPAKDLFVQGDVYTEYNMPGDIYFSCLDGTYNYDGDAYWGEPTDGEGGGDVDMYAEVYVGRACAGNTTEAARFVNKTIWYLNGQHSCIENVLLVGEYLGFGGIADWGGNYLDELIGGSDEHDYVTVGFDPEIFNVDTLYERDGSWTQADLVNLINNVGVHILNHLGHGAPDYAMKLYSSDILSVIHNDDLIFVYSQTCDAGEFDGFDCWAEHMNIKIDEGAFAVIMNARSGWGEWYSTDGPSQRFNREFWDAVFSEQMGELGRANADSKEDNVWRIDWDCMRWCCYELNLFGDPTIFMRGACSDAGTVVFDSNKYACESSAEITVVDCGLNVDDGVADSVVVDIDSDSESGVEHVTLTETGLATARFEGSINLSMTNSPGVLLVAEGDTVTATYIDADDGEGHYDVEVTATAVVDCTPPEIWNVQTTNIEPRSATVTFDANEIVRGTVHYGLSCENLSWSASGGYGNPASVNVSGLQDDTTYFYMVVAADEAGNEVSDDNNGNCYVFTTPEVPDFFTESFESGGNDLDYLTLLFTPNGSVDYYAGCTEEIDELPTDPSGGSTIYLSDDDYEYRSLSGGATIALYGVEYSGFYVGSNGYITFGAGDTTYLESLDVHFSLPRISALFRDLNPSTGGTVSWLQLDDRAVVTWQNVPEYGTSNSNTFQIELYFNGDIRISYLSLDASRGLAGLSEGVGLDPDYYPSDLSAMGSCGPRPPNARDGQVFTPANTAVTITLEATDDGLPEPPHLDFIIGALPTNGTLSDPGADVIESVPYTLVDGGNQVVYTPDTWFMAEDYFQFYANDGGEPPEGGNSNIATVVIDVTPPASEPIYEFPLDSDPGWATEGQWAFGQPTGGGSHNRDPDAGHTGANVYGYNLSGDYTNNMPAYYLTTSAIDCSDLLLVELRFWRWLGVESSQFDHATVEVSNDGSNWTEVWSNPATSISDSSWQPMSLDISAVADGEPTVYIRWGMGPTDYSNTYPGWNVDDVEIWAVDTGPECLGDLDGDGDVDLGDLSILLAHYGMTSGAAYEDGDLDGDGDVDLTDLSALLAVYGTTCP
jgi:hypothetical protein